MNIFFRELKSYRNGLFFWSIGMIALVASGMAKFAAYSGTGQSITELMDQFPRSIQVIFGLSGFDLAKASGFYGVLFIYIALMATVHAVLLGTDIIGKEERDKTSEFLFVKPISRSKAVSAKLLAGLCNVIILNIVTWLSSDYFVKYFNHGVALSRDIAILMAGLFFLQLLFFFAGAAIAAAVTKPKTAPSIATSVMLITFILAFVININEKLDILKYLTPFKYFDARNLMTDGRLDPVYVSISLVIIFIMIAVSYLTYTDRDLNI